MDTHRYRRAPDDSYWQECVNLRPSLLRIAASRCQGILDPEDIVQEAFLRGAQARHLELKSLRPFLVTVIQRLCVDEARRRAVAGRLGMHPRLLPPASEDPAELACDRAEARWLADRSAGLSPSDRRLLSLLTTGRAPKEIADELGTTPQSTYSAVYRLRRRISLACSRGT
ncbi:sigma-70 family RNA polymerase sigma factor [Kibdelosporangium philippinense]|uniref:RNA polymerase sigma factor SigS n=1 Tax=Kibdelosporangium philippinense TaxID=211113 RepID=A0ABS8Z2D7_9PSEU|nr:sigma-70 family RNA polymerase sigma factor [Kibdelosporangium philippinense]MCE7002101.1 sigma-70 family RNA polymerase sigma factor [Kibdelosporangium philippinense]